MKISATPNLAPSRRPFQDPTRRETTGIYRQNNPNRKQTERCNSLITRVIHPREGAQVAAQTTLWALFLSGDEDDERTSATTHPVYPAFPSSASPLLSRADYLPLFPFRHPLQSRPNPQVPASCLLSTVYVRLLLSRLLARIRRGVELLRESRTSSQPLSPCACYTRLHPAPNARKCSNFSLPHFLYVADLRFPTGHRSQTPFHYPVPTPDSKTPKILLFFGNRKLAPLPIKPKLVHSAPSRPFLDRSRSKTITKLAPNLTDLHLTHFALSVWSPSPLSPPHGLPEIPPAPASCPAEPEPLQHPCPALGHHINPSFSDNGFSRYLQRQRNPNPGPPSNSRVCHTHCFNGPTYEEMTQPSRLRSRRHT